jgi:predicted Zn-dependent protease
LEYGYQQQGRFGEARKMTVGCQAAVMKVPPSTGGEMMDPQTMAYGSFVDMWSRYLIDTEEWSGEIANLRVPRGKPLVDHAMDFVDGFAAVRTGRIDDARRAFEQLRRDADAVAPMIKMMDNPAMTGRIGILEQQLGGLIELAEGRTAKAIETLRAAADAEGKLPFDFGPPMIEKPSHELLGEALLSTGNAKDAREAFEQALARAPERTTSLVGLMRAAEKMGDRKKVDEIRAKLKTIWRHADHPIATEASR